MKNSILLTILTLIISSTIAEAIPATLSAQVQQNQANNLPTRDRKQRRQHNKKPFYKMRENAFGDVNLCRYNGRIRSQYDRELSRIKRHNQPKTLKTQSARVKKVLASAENE